MKHFRPISFCNVLYKIIAKVLANRLKTIFPTIFNESRSTFILGRSITVNVIVAFELFHHMKKKARGHLGDVAPKVNMSKAYDRIR